MAVYRRGLRSKVRRATPVNLYRTSRALLDPGTILVDWVNRGPVKHNWGDAIAPVLAEKMSGRNVVNARDVLSTGSKPVYTTIGSMLGVVRYENLTVWGSGFVDSVSSFRVPPHDIRAVRGPLTRQRILDSGLECPEVFGDPALLYPRFYRPTVEKRFSLGIIPHFREHELPAVQRLGARDGVNIIDITSGIEAVADQINSCEKIASSSLHGLVAGDGYGIPSIWIRFSDRPYGEGFKFRDYLESVGRGREADSLEITEQTSVEQIMDCFVDYELDLDIGQFIEACPFLDREVFERNSVGNGTR